MSRGFGRGSSRSRSTRCAGRAALQCARCSSGLAARSPASTSRRTAVSQARRVWRLTDGIGGEGSGGVVCPAVHAGRDAPVAAALLLTLLARDGRRVSELVAAAPRYAIVKAKAERGTWNAERGLEDAYAALRRRFPEATADTQDGLRLAWRARWRHVR